MKKSLVKILTCLLLIIFSIIFVKLKEGVVFINNDLRETETFFAYYIDDESTTQLPAKDSGYILSDKSNCNNGVKISWDELLWSAHIDFMNYEQEAKERTRCNLYFTYRDDTNTMIKAGTSGTINDNIYTRGTKYAKTLKSVVFESTKNPYENATEVVDFSLKKDGSVLGYYVKKENKEEYTLYIQADGKIKPNPDASSYFVVYDAEMVEVEGTEEVVPEGVEGTEEVTPEGVEGTEEVVPEDVEGTGDIVEVVLESTLDITFSGFENFDTSYVTNMYRMFYGVNITELDLSSWNTKNVTNMAFMFAGMSNLANLNISNFDTSNVTNMYGMFAYNGLANLNLSHFLTSNVTDMSFMFQSMPSLTNLDLSTFDISKVTNMTSMFLDSSKLNTIIYGSNFIHKENMNINDMFYGCPANTPTHASWNGIFQDII